MSEPKYIIGIDLGTTHCVLAYTDADVPEHEAPAIHLFDIPQVVSEGEVQARELLPSFLLLPGPHDVSEGGLSLPWRGGADSAVGVYARDRGAELPSRLVSSAKSWLSHSGVDRKAPILPWDAPEDARRVSPVEASRRYLEHLRAAWNEQMAQDDPDARLEAQQIYLTVPASFDPVARELTAQAAREAGFEHLTLLEEPQAAFYAWILEQGDTWREAVEVGESILVCDVGGGTTDLSLIEVTQEDGTLDLRRSAVGNHILLGGDNMDLTLAYALRAKLAQSGTQLDNWQFRALVQGCRKAKERLLSDPDRDAEPISIAGRGSSLVGGTIRTELTREEIENALVDGFFPHVEAEARPQRQARTGVREMGLPYESDPAVTRHLAGFLGRQAGGDGQEGEAVPYPSAVLFNGGVMKADALRERVLGVLRAWRGDDDVSAEDGLRELPSASLDLAVARGAVYYGTAQRGRGVRIRAGAARSYYIGVESAMPAVPGVPTPVNALCVVPFGMEEGTEAQITERTFGLVVGDDAVFRLLASNTRKEDHAGQTVEDWEGAIEEVATMEAHLDARSGAEGGTVVPVVLESRVTEVGTLELWCVARESDERWKLEFDIRQEDGGERVEGEPAGDVEA